MLTVALEKALRSQGVCGERVLAAVSGGADSVALLRGLANLAPRCGLTLIVAHFDHGLRGAESTADAVWVEELAASLGIRCCRGTTESALDPAATGVEEQSRDLRYRFFEATARAERCRVVLTAHTADDQAETVLHHVIRGTGWAGLRGIPAERVLCGGLRLVRPLLAVGRSEVLSYLAELGQEYRVDVSNFDVSLTRNALRHEILPLLRERWNPRVAEALCSLSELAVETDACLGELADRYLQEALLTAGPHRLTLDREALRALPALLLQELFRRLWVRQGWSRQDLGRKSLQRLAQLVLADGKVSAMDLPGGVRAAGQGGILELERNAGLESSPSVENP